MPGEPAPVEKLLRGVRALFGNQVPRKETFFVRTKDATTPMDMKGEFAFNGLDVERSPLIDLVHALTQALRYPETDRLLAVLRKLMEENENAAAAPVYMGLAVDKRADAHPNAVIVGYDGKPGTPNEFWDDLIAIGMRMAERPGLLKDVTEALTSEEGVASARLMARFMGFKDEVTYDGYPLKVGTDGKLSQADADKINKPIVHEMADAVTMRGNGQDIGMNRSLFQRLVSTIYATNGAPNCNKAGATLSAKDPTTGTMLVFPDPTKKPAQCNGDLICDTAAALAYTTIDGLCGVKAGAPTGTFKRCEFVQQSNGAEMHMRAMIGSSEVKLKNEQLKCLSDAGLAGDLGATQESSSQIKGFTLKPTAESIARFVHAPRNKFVTDLFDPLPTLFGEPVITYEPNMLMALEATHSPVQVGGKPQSFLTASKALAAAFDKHETFEDTPNGKEAKGGYMFADLLGMLHQHWPSRGNTDCPRTDDHPVCKALNLTGTACSAGCSQSLDPSKPYYSRQSNLVSYEPLLIQAFEDERLSDLLALSTKVIAGMQIECEDGKTRDGLTIVGDFFERMLKPDPALAIYSTKRKYGKTNTCVGEQVDPSTGTGTCGCPSGSTPVDASDPTTGCKLAGGAIVPRGKIVGLTPLHVALDALRRFDDVFAEPTWADRLKPWREARSALVDQFLAVTKTIDPMNPTDATKATYKLANPRSRKVGVMLVDFVRGRIKRYRDLDPQNGTKLTEWANGLPTRLAGVLAHPLTARGLDLYEELWKKIGAGGPADEMAQLNTYLLNPERADVFGGLVLAAAD
ncbi:MAG TPA: hypothetical protein VJU61_27465, partial [Polyangiaceae bacterium]|nr:hypothetical protein [Polyangiaceae bacterium]